MGALKGGGKVEMGEKTHTGRGSFSPGVQSSKGTRDYIISCITNLIHVDYDTQLWSDQIIYPKNHYQLR